jgi:metal-responsive CopG/Arc/MetJ family transcriptional regulator
MKAIQITLDEELLERLDGDEEVRRDGRSAVLRRAAELYLRQRRDDAIAAAYRRGYAEAGGIGPEFDGWSSEGSWPGR